jgi:hypothetical protein
MPLPRTPRDLENIDELREAMEREWKLWARIDQLEAALITAHQNLEDYGHECTPECGIWRAIYLDMNPAE